MNLIIIGTNCYDIGREIWSANTNYVLLESNNIADKHYKAYIKDKKTITIADSEQFKNKSVNETLDLLNKNSQIPIFIAADKDCFERLMYTNISPAIWESLLLCGKPDDKDYNDILQTAKGYLYGKGMIKPDDKSLRPSKRGQRRAVKK